MTLVSLTDEQERQARQVAKGLYEIKIPKSPEHLTAQQEVDRKLQASASDIALIEYYIKTPALLDCLQRQTSDADLVIVSNPYLYPAVVRISK